MMRIAALLLLLGTCQVCIAQTTSEVEEVSTPPPPTPSPWFKCPSDGFHPHPYDCTLYFQCSNNLAWQQQCPDDLYFNFQTKRCDFPANVNCTASTPPPDFTVSKYEAEAFFCPASDGNFPIPGQCVSSYYICIDWTAYMTSCPGANIFDPLTGSCVTADKASCSTTAAPTTTTTQAPTTIEAVFTCPEGVDGSFAVPGKCVPNYYYCIDDTPYPQRCPGTALFDPISLVCTSPDKVSCLATTTTTTTEATTTTTTTQATTTTTQAPFTCPSSDGNYPIPGTCSGQYFMCIGGEAYIGSCPGTSVFDPLTLVCTSPSVVSCRSTTAAPTTTTTTEATTTTSTQAPTTAAPFSCPQPDGNFPVPGTCSGQYFICITGDVYIGQCPGTSIFDPLTLVCTSPSIASCLSTAAPSTTTTTEATTTTSTEATTTTKPFTCPQPDGNFPIPGTCSGQYFMCVGGNVYIGNCPGTSIFDPLTLVCTSPSLASCLSTAAPSTTVAPTTEAATTTTEPTTVPPTTQAATTTTTATPGSGVCPQPDGNFLNPADCSTFYSCSAGNGILNQCPPGLLFNPALGACDWSYNVPSCQGNTFAPPAGPTTEAAGTTTTTTTTTTTAPTFTCPQSDGNFALPGQCSSSYYICIGWVAYPATCPGTTVFDPVTQKCSASCGEATTTTTAAPTTTTTTAPTFTCPQSDGNFALPGQCSSSYFICIGWVAYPATCPGTTVFDPVTQKCSASCGDPATTSTSTTTTTAAPTTTTTTAPTFTCPQSDGNFALPGQCSSSYYICIGWVAYPATCPGTTVFDPVTQKCSASCGEATTTTTAATTTTTTAPTFTCPQSDGNFALPGQCSSSYYICIGWVAYPATCPGTTVFDPSTQKCSASCGEVTTTTTAAPTTTTTAPTFTCPQSDGNFALPGQCSSSYYICIGWVAYPAACPGTSVFDPSTQKCSASCGDPATTTTSTTTTTAAPTTTTTTTTAPTFTCPQSDGNFALPGQCSSSYYICIGWVAYPATCPGTNVFDPATQKCSASCSEPTTTTTTTTTTTEPTTTTTTTVRPSTSGPFVCPQPDGSFANPSDCTSYYVCSHGTPFINYCPPGLAYNPALASCDWLYNVPGCQGETNGPTQVPDTTTTTTAAPTTTTKAPTFTCPQSDGNFALPGQCSSSYFICIGWVAYPATCPGTTVFDPATQKCSAACGEATTTTTTTTTTAVPTTTTTTASPTTAGPFVCPQPDGTFANPNDCGSYYQCSFGTPIIKYCSPGLVFNPALSACDWPYNVPGCQGNTAGPTAGPTQAPDTTTTTTTAAPTTTTTTASPTTSGPFVCPQPDGTFANPNDCSSYYSCSNNVPVIMNCSPGLVYDPVLGYCNWPENVPSCQGPQPTQSPTGAPTNAPTTTTTARTTTVSAGFTCPQPDGFFANPNDCKSYYRCYGGIPYLYACSPGLVYNPSAQLCDWPYNVPGCAVEEDPDVIAPRIPRDVNLGAVDNFTCPGIGVYPADDCDKYYTCYENSPVYLYRCKDNWLFDLRYSGCNYPELTDCGNRTNPGLTTAPTTTTTTSGGSNGTVGPTTSRPGFTCKEDGYFPLAPDACVGSYYVCVDGVAYTQTCPGNAVFDPERGLCVRPETASCYQNSTISSFVTTPTAPSTSGPFTCPTPDGTFSDPTSCNFFYTCSAGIPSKVPCPDGLVFNPQVLVCDFPFNVPGCAGEESKDLSRDTDLGIPPGYTCPGLGIFPHPECDKYITCYEGETARLWLCANDYLFDLRYNGCNFPELTDCGNRTRPGSTTPTPTSTPTPTVPSFNCPSDGFFPIPDTCQANYFLCVAGTPYLQTCPGNSIFDPLELKCVPADQASCIKPPFKCPQPSGFFPVAPGACSSSYYSCVDDVPYEMTCPGTTLFDPDRGFCATPESIASCNNSTTTGSTATQSTTQSTTQSVTPTGTTESATDSTTQSTSPLSTQSTTGQTTSSAGPTPTTTPGPTSSPGPFTCPPLNGNYPNPSDCGSYYVCVDGRPTLIFCPPGLYFNQATGTCDYPENVDCNNSFQNLVKSARDWYRAPSKSIKAL